VGVGIGYIFAALVSSVARNPAARERCSASPFSGCVEKPWRFTRW